MLAPVLDPLDVARPSRRAAHGTRTSSGHGCMILTPKPPPTSGAMHSTLASGQPELGRDGRPHAGRGLGGGVEPQRLLVAVPAGVDALALHRACRRCARCRGRGSACAGRRRWRRRRRRPPAPCARRRCPGTSSWTSTSAGAGLLQTHDDGQLLVVDPDPLAGVLGDVAVGRDDHDDGLADVVDHARAPGSSRSSAWVSVGCGISSGSGSADPAVAGPRGCRSPTTPSTSSASVTSMSRMRAWACGLRTNAAASASWPRSSR